MQAVFQEAFGSAPSRTFMRKFIEKHFSRKVGYFILAKRPLPEAFQRKLERRIRENNYIRTEQTRDEFRFKKCGACGAGHERIGKKA